MEGRKEEGGREEGGRWRERRWYSQPPRQNYTVRMVTAVEERERKEIGERGKTDSLPSNDGRKEDVNRERKEGED